MLSDSPSLNNPIKAFAAAIVIAATVLFLALLPASAETDSPDAQVLSYLHDGNYSPDGIGNLRGGITLRLGQTDVAFLYAEATVPGYVG